MRRIFKFPLIAAPVDSQTIMLHKDAEILSFQLQNNIPTIWARVYDGKTLRVRNVYCYETGQNCDGSLHLHFLGTLQLGAFVYHYFINEE